MISECILISKWSKITDKAKGLLNNFLLEPGSPSVPVSTCWVTVQSIYTHMYFVWLGFLLFCFCLFKKIVVYCIYVSRGCFYHPTGFLEFFSWQCTGTCLILFKLLRVILQHGHANIYSAVPQHPMSLFPLL